MTGSVRTLAGRLGAGGIDRASAVAMLSNIASLVMGPVTVVLVATQLTPTLQGYYYTFSSLSLLQVVAELGIGQALMQTVSHEWPRLAMSATGRVHGDVAAIARVRALTRAAWWWALGTAALLAIALYIAPIVVFARATDGTTWVGPWFAMALLMVVGHLHGPLWGLLEGCHQINAFWTFRLVQQIINGLGLWVGLMSGAGLWTVAIAKAATLIWTWAFMAVRFPHLLSSLLQGSCDSSVRHSAELWPLQWRGTVGYVGTFLVSQLFVPFLFVFSGPTAAGQMGMTVALGWVLLSLSAQVVVTKAPIFGGLVAAGRFGEFDRMFARAFRTVVMLAFALSCIGWAAIAGLRVMYPSLADRVLEPGSAAAYLLFNASGAVVLALSTYLRAFKRDPMAFVYAASVGLIFAIAVPLSKAWGAAGLCLSAALVSACFQVPCAFAYYRRYRLRAL